MALYFHDHYGISRNALNNVVFLQKKASVGVVSTFAQRSFSKHKRGVFVERQIDTRVIQEALLRGIATLKLSCILWKVTSFFNLCHSASSNVEWFYNKQGSNSRGKISLGSWLEFFIIYFSSVSFRCFFIYFFPCDYQFFGCFFLCYCLLYDCTVTRCYAFLMLPSYSPRTMGVRRIPYICGAFLCVFLLPIWQGTSMTFQLSSLKLAIITLVQKFYNK